MRQGICVTDGHSGHLLMSAEQKETKHLSQVHLLKEVL